MPSNERMVAARPGSICFVGLATSDPARAKAFYKGLFGWQSEDVPSGETGTYTALRHDGREVGILHRQTPEARAARVAPHWTPYLVVEDADSSALRAHELGGTLVRGARDVGDAGRVVAVRDPLGGIVSLWQPYSLAGAELLDEVSALCWHELVTTNVAGLMTFYGRLLGWEYEAGPNAFTTVLSSGTPIASMRDSGGGDESRTADWIPYFGVERVDEAERRAEHHGGRILAAAAFTLIGWSALVADPLGARFAILEHPVRV